MVYLVGPNIPLPVRPLDRYPMETLWDRKMGRIFVRMLVDVAMGKKFQDVFVPKKF